MHETKDKTDEQIDILMSILVQVSRIYDLLVAGLRTVPDAEVINILNDHEKGVLRGAAPALSSFGKDFDDDDDRE